jgi:hypothetical protein
MLRRIKNKVLNYFFEKLEFYQKKKEQQKHQNIISQFKNRRGFYIDKDYKIINPQYIEIGNNFSGERFMIEAWDKYGEQDFKPTIKIGNNVVFNTDIHIVV